MGIFKRIEELETDKILMQQEIDDLKESMSQMNKKINTMAKSTAGIPYGLPVSKRQGFGVYVSTQNRKNLSEVVQLILQQLKLEIEHVPALMEDTKLVKIKPIKPL